MAKKLIKTQFRGDLAGGAVSNVQIIETFEFTDDETNTAIATKDIPRAATPEELAAIVTPAVATVGAANETLTAQNVELQKQVEALTARLDAAVRAVQEVAHADASWDATVRTSIETVLQTEAK